MLAGRVSVTEALRRKLDLSVGRPETQREECTHYITRNQESVRKIELSGDSKRANERAMVRREQAEFEKRLQQLRLVEDSDSDSDSDVEGDGNETKGIHLKKSLSAIPRGRVQADLSWSEQAEELDVAIKGRRTKSKARFSEVCKRLRTLKLRNCGILEMDDGLLKLSTLEELNLSRNKLYCVRNLPPSLLSFNAFDNSINRLELSDSIAAKHLLHLGLGYNHVSSVEPWIQDCSSLLSLDLSYNCICNLEATLAALSSFVPRLRILHLQGNPIALLPKYRTQVHRHLPQLKILDDVKFEEEDTSEARGEEMLDVDASIQVHCTVSSMNIVLVPAEPLIEGEESESKEDVSVNASEEENNHEEVPFERRKLFVRMVFPHEEFKDSQLVEFRIPQDEDEANAESDGILNFSFENYAMNCAYRPSVQLRDMLELRGIYFELFLVSEVCKYSKDNVADAAAEHNENEEPDSAIDAESKLIVCKSHEELVASGALSTLNCLAPEVMSSVESLDEKVPLICMKSATDKPAIIKEVSLKVSFSLNAPSQNSAGEDNMP